MPNNKTARHRRYERAIVAMWKAHQALGEIMELQAPGDDSRTVLRNQIGEYAGYLETATWWRDKESA